MRQNWQNSGSDKYNKEKVNYFEIGLGRTIADGLFSAAMGAVYLDGVGGKEYPKVKELLKDSGKRKELEKALESKIEGYSFKIGAYNDQRTSVRVYVKKK